MRQFFTWRWWLTIAALVGCGVFLVVVVGKPGDKSLADVVRPEPHRVDLVQVAAGVDTEVGWQVSNGFSRGTADVYLADGSTLAIMDGTAGVDQCAQINELGGCMLLADTLGDAIIWFALVDMPKGSNEIKLPPIVELLDGVTYARLANGWELPLLSVVERRCNVDTLNLENFLDRFGNRHDTFLDVEQREISAVQCRRK